MLEINLGKYSEKWFYYKVDKYDSIRFVCYLHCDKTDNILGFKKEIIYTKMINLRMQEEFIINDISNNCIKKINRVKNKVNFEIENDINKYILFYNEFAFSRGLSKLKKNFIKYNKYIIITKATNNNETIVMHSYIIDPIIGKVRLLHSVSFFHEIDDTSMRNYIGMVNRYLHFKDIFYFKEIGFNYYDFGGYACDTDNNKLININRFKDQFGGNIIIQSNYFSYPLYISGIILKHFRKYKKIIIRQ